MGPLPASRRLERWLQSVEGPQVLVSEGESRSLDPLNHAQQWCAGLVAWVQGQTLADADAVAVAVTLADIGAGPNNCPACS